MSNAFFPYIGICSAIMVPAGLARPRGGKSGGALAFEPGLEVGVVPDGDQGGHVQGGPGLHRLRAPVPPAQPWAPSSSSRRSPTPSSAAATPGPSTTPAWPTLTPTPTNSIYSTFNLTKFNTAVRFKGRIFGNFDYITDLSPEKVTTSNRTFPLVLTTGRSTDEAEALLGRTDHRHSAGA